MRNLVFMFLKKIISVILILTMLFTNAGVITFANSISESEIELVEEEDVDEEQIVVLDKFVDKLKNVNVKKITKLIFVKNKKEIKGELENLTDGIDAYIDGTDVIVNIAKNVNAKFPEDSSKYFSSMNEVKTIEGIDLIDATDLSNISNMFEFDYNLEHIDISSFNLSNNISKMIDIFRENRSLKTIDMTGIDTSKIEDMRGLFSHCKSLKKIKGLDTIDTTNAKKLSWMFYLNQSLENLDLSNFTFNDGVEVDSLFLNANNLKKVYINDTFPINKINEMKANSKIEFVKEDYINNYEENNIEPISEIDETVFENVEINENYNSNLELEEEPEEEVENEEEIELEEEKLIEPIKTEETQINYSLNGEKEEYIEDVKMVLAKKEEAIKIFSENDYIMIDQNLNQNTIGNEIYIGYKTTNDKNEAITGLGERWFNAKNRNPKSFIGNYHKYEYIGVTDFDNNQINTNEGGSISSKYVYLYQTKEKLAGEAIKNINIIFSEKEIDREELNKDGFNVVVNSNDNSVSNFNRGLLSSYIYIQYTDKKKIENTYEVVEEEPEEEKETDSEEELIEPIKTEETQINYSLNGEKEEYIEDVKMVLAKKEEAIKIFSENDYIMIDQNLNQNTIGNEIYIGYKTTNDKNEAITGLGERWFNAKNRNPKSFIGNYHKYEYIGVTDFDNNQINTNEGGSISSKYVYLYQTKEKLAGEAIKNINIIFSEKEIDREELNKDGFNVVVNSNDNNVSNFNRGLFSSYIYIQYTDKKKIENTHEVVEEEKKNEENENIEDAKYIKDVKMVVAKKEEAIKIFEDNNYHIVDMNLNQNVPGKEIYLGYITTKNKNEAVTSLGELWSNSKYEKITEFVGEYHKYNFSAITDFNNQLINTNEGAPLSGRRVYLYQTKDKQAGEPITDIKIVFFENEQSKGMLEKKNFELVTNSNDNTLSDFSRGIINSFIYMYYTKETDLKNISNFDKEDEMDDYLSVTDVELNRFFDELNDISVDEITKIIFVHNKNNLPGKMQKLKKGILCFVDGTEITINIMKNTNVKLPENSSNYFSGFKNLKTIEGLSLLDVKDVRSVKGMFSKNENLTSIDASFLNNLSNVDSLEYLFSNSNKLNTVNMKGVVTENIRTISNMFGNCIELKNIIGLDTFNTENVKNFSYMFLNVSGFDEIDLSNFEFMEEASVYRMFEGMDVKKVFVNKTFFDVKKQPEIKAKSGVMFIKVDKKDIDVSNLKINLEEILPDSKNILSLKGNVITLLKDTKIKKPMNFKNVDVIFDLNGHTLTGPNDDCAFYILDSTFTLIDSSYKKDSEKKLLDNSKNYYQGKIIGESEKATVCVKNSTAKFEQGYIEGASGKILIKEDNYAYYKGTSYMKIGTYDNKKLSYLNGVPAIEVKDSNVDFSGSYIKGGDGKSYNNQRGGSGAPAVLFIYEEDKYQINMNSGNILGGDGGEGKKSNVRGMGGDSIVVNNKILSMNKENNETFSKISIDGGFGGGNGGEAINIVGSFDEDNIVFNNALVKGGKGGDGNKNDDTNFKKRINEENVSNLDFKKNKQLDTKLVMEEEVDIDNLPTQYLTKEVTSLKKQEHNAWCWMFTGLSVAETYLLKYYPEFCEENKTGKEFDLSEIAAMKAVMHQPADPLGNAPKSYKTHNHNEPTENDEGKYSWLREGGSVDIFSLLTAQDRGLVKESLAPISDLLDKERGCDEYEEDLGSSKNNIAFLKDYRNYIHEDYIDNDILLHIKEGIIKKGSLYLSSRYFAEGKNEETQASIKIQDFVKRGDNLYVYSPTGSIEFEDIGVTGYRNHSVSIIGWDDTILASNFKSTYTYGDGTEEEYYPYRDGAFIVKNSMGSIDYVSYDSYVNCISELSFGISEEYDNVYYYDTALNQSYLYTNSEGLEFKSIGKTSSLSGISVHMCSDVSDARIKIEAYDQDNQKRSYDIYKDLHDGLNYIDLEDELVDEIIIKGNTNFIVNVSASSLFKMGMDSYDDGNNKWINTALTYNNYFPRIRAYTKEKKDVVDKMKITINPAKNKNGKIIFDNYDIPTLMTFDDEYIVDKNKYAVDYYDFIGLFIKKRIPNAEFEGPFFEIKNLMNDIIVEARYEAIKYNIEYDLDGGMWPSGYIAPTYITDEINYDYNNNKDLKSPIANGKDFKGWSVNGSSDIYTNIILNLDQNKMILKAIYEDIAIYNKNVTTVEVKNNKGVVIFNNYDIPKIIGRDDIYVVDESKYQIDYYDFIGLFIKEDLEGANFEGPVSQISNLKNDIIVEARYEAIKYNIEYDLLGGSWPNEYIPPTYITDEIDYNYLSDYNLLTPVLLDYEFKGWHVNGSEEITNHITLNLNENQEMILTAEYVEVSTVSMRITTIEALNKNGKVLFNNYDIPKILNPNDVYKVDENKFKIDYYKFVGLFIKKDVANAEFEGPVREIRCMDTDIFVEARYEAIEYKINYDLSGGNWPTSYEPPIVITDEIEYDFINDPNLKTPILGAREFVAWSVNEKIVEGSEDKKVEMITTIRLDLDTNSDVMHLKAYYEPIKILINYNSREDLKPYRNSTQTTDSILFELSAEYTVADIKSYYNENDKYDFIGWEIAEVVDGKVDIEKCIAKEHTTVMNKKIKLIQTIKPEAVELNDDKKEVYINLQPIYTIKTKILTIDHFYNTGLANYFNNNIVTKIVFIDKLVTDKELLPLDEDLAYYIENDGKIINIVLDKGAKLICESNSFVRILDLLAKYEIVGLDLFDFSKSGYRSMINWVLPDSVKWKSGYTPITSKEILDPLKLDSNNLVIADGYSFVGFNVIAHLADEFVKDLGYINEIPKNLPYLYYTITVEISNVIELTNSLLYDNIGIEKNKITKISFVKEKPEIGDEINISKGLDIYVDDTKITYYIKAENAKFPSNSSQLFANLTNITDITGLGNVNFSDITIMNEMFKNNKKLTTIDFGNANMPNVMNIQGLFNGDEKLKNVYNFNIDLIRNAKKGNVFKGVKSVPLVKEYRDLLDTNESIIELDFAGGTGTQLDAVKSNEDVVLPKLTKANHKHVGWVWEKDNKKYTKIGKDYHKDIKLTAQWMGTYEIVKQQYISDIVAEWGDNEDSIKKALTDEQYTVIDVDMNIGSYKKGEEAPKIYLGVKYTTDKNEAISNIIADVKDSSNGRTKMIHKYSAYTGVTRVSDRSKIVDFNEAAGGQFIYLFFTRHSNDSGAPITGLRVESANSNVNYPAEYRKSVFVSNNPSHYPQDVHEFVREEERDYLVDFNRKSKGIDKKEGSCPPIYIQMQKYDKLMDSLNSWNDYAKKEEYNPKANKSIDTIKLKNPDPLVVFSEIINYMDRAYGLRKENITELNFIKADQTYPADKSVWGSNIYWTIDGTVVNAYMKSNVKLPANCASFFANFSSARKITGMDKLDTSNVTNMTAMFENNTLLEEIDISSFNTSKVVDMRFMFKSCSLLRNIKGFEKINTRKVTNMSEMFYNARALSSIDISGMEFDKTVTTDYMFFNCTSLTRIYRKKDFEKKNPMRWRSGMITNCPSLVCGNGVVYEKWYSSVVKQADHHVWARIGTSEIDGYFTKKQEGEDFDIDEANIGYHFKLDAGLYLKDLKIIAASKDIAKKKFEEEGYKIIEKNLNLLSDRQQVYMGYLITTDVNQAITLISGLDHRYGSRIDDDSIVINLENTKDLAKEHPVKLHGKYYDCDYVAMTDFDNEPQMIDYGQSILFKDLYLYYSKNKRFDPLTEFEFVPVPGNKDAFKYVTANKNYAAVAEVDSGALFDLAAGAGDRHMYIRFSGRKYSK